MKKKSTHPWKSNTSNGSTQHISHDSRIRVGSWKISMESRTVPMCDTWHYDSFNISHNILPWFRALWCLTRNQWTQISRFNWWKYTSVLIRNKIKHVEFQVHKKLSETLRNKSVIRLWDDWLWLLALTDQHSITENCCNSMLCC